MSNCLFVSLQTTLKQCHHVPRSSSNTEFTPTLETHNSNDSIAVYLQHGEIFFSEGKGFHKVIGRKSFLFCLKFCSLNVQWPPAVPLWIQKCLWLFHYVSLVHYWAPVAWFALQISLEPNLEDLLMTFSFNYLALTINCWTLIELCKSDPILLCCNKSKEMFTTLGWSSLLCGWRMPFTGLTINCCYSVIFRWHWSGTLPPAVALMSLLCAAISFLSSFSGWAIFSLPFPQFLL